ncbi:MAG: cofactor-independent phosphoglycerate mutase [Candidatus Latescibacteria bacterium]|nr:cofactor-independent phosphoglycerate mutase [Candidatus Latescibacterota bacterium]
MKFVVLIGDGMGDYPRDDLGGRTVLEAANTPNMDWIAANGRGGFAQTIPPEMHPGSDVANMEIMGYDTTCGFTGRAVFEALSMGRHLHDEDVAFRANLVTLENGYMKDYSAGHITTQEAGELIKGIDEALGSDTLRFYPGVSYRHLMIWSGGNDSMATTPPHDIIGKEYEEHLPKGDGSEFIRSIMENSKPVLEASLINKKRLATGKLPANSVWLWGQGKKLSLKTIEEKYGIMGGVISAVDLIKGIGVVAGLKPEFIPGATGYIDTNYRGKAEAALKILETRDFVYLHVEAPDEAAHNGDVKMKIKAIEDFDSIVVGIILETLKSRNDMAVLLTCDHRTPVVERTHTREPVPFCYYGPGVEKDNMTSYSEKAAESGVVKMIKGHKLLDLFLGDFITL